MKKTIFNSVVTLILIIPCAQKLWAQDGGWSNSNTCLVKSANLESIKVKPGKHCFIGRSLQLLPRRENGEIRYWVGSWIRPDIATSTYLNVVDDICSHQRISTWRTKKSQSYYTEFDIYNPNFDPSLASYERAPMTDNEAATEFRHTRTLCEADAPIENR